MACTETGNSAQYEGTSFEASHAVSLGSATTTGNGIFVAITWYIGGGATTPTVADDQGNTYTKLVEQAASVTDAVTIYLAKNITGSATPSVTVTAHTANTFLSIGVSEVTGQDQATQAGATNSATGTGTTTPSAGNVTPASGDLAVAAVSHDLSTSGSITAGTGWTRRTNIPGAGGICLGVETQAGAGSAVTGDWTFGSNANNYAAVVVVIQQASGGGGGVAVGADATHHRVLLGGGY